MITFGYALWKLPEDANLASNRNRMLQLATAGRGNVLNANSNPPIKSTMSAYRDLWQVAASLALLLFVLDIVLLRRLQ